MAWPVQRRPSVSSNAPMADGQAPPPKARRPSISAYEAAFTEAHNTTHAIEGDAVDCGYQKGFTSANQHEEKWSGDKVVSGYEQAFTGAHGKKEDDKATTISQTRRPSVASLMGQDGAANDPNGRASRRPSVTSLFTTTAGEPVEAKEESAPQARARRPSIIDSMKGSGNDEGVVGSTPEQKGRRPSVAGLFTTGEPLEQAVAQDSKQKQSNDAGDSQGARRPSIVQSMGIGQNKNDASPEKTQRPKVSASAAAGSENADQNAKAASPNTTKPRAGFFGSLCGKKQTAA